MGYNREGLKRNGVSISIRAGVYLLAWAEHGVQDADWQLRDGTQALLPNGLIVGYETRGTELR